MKTLTLLILLISANLMAQDNSKFTKSERAIITSVGTSVAVYSFVKPGFKEIDVLICLFGIISASIPYLFDKLPKWIEVNSSGINIKLKYKIYKCTKQQLKL